MVISSRCSASTLFSIRTCASVSRSLNAACASSARARSAGIAIALGVDAGADLLAEDDALDVPLGEQVEDDDRHPVVHAQRERGAVHDGQAAVEHLEVCEVREDRKSTR